MSNPTPDELKVIEDHYGIIDETETIHRAEAKMLKQTAPRSLTPRQKLRNAWYARCLGISLEELMAKKAKAKKGKPVDELRWWRRQQKLRSRNIPLSQQSKGDLENRFFHKFEGELCSVELECIFPNGQQKPKNSTVLSPYLVKMCDDGSISYNRSESQDEDSESPRPSASTAEVKVTFRSRRPLRLQSVVEKLRERGAIVNVSCGTHAHFDMRHLGFREASRLAKRLIKCLPALSKLVARSRLSNRFCQMNNPVYLGRRYVHTRSRYHAINFRSAYSKWRTIENRLHGGTLDFWKIIGWVDLSNWIMQSREVDKVAMAKAQTERAEIAKRNGISPPAKLDGHFPMQITIEDLIRMKTLPDHLRGYVWRRFRNFYPAEAEALGKRLIEDGETHLWSPGHSEPPAKRNQNNKEEE